MTIAPPAPAAAPVAVPAPEPLPLLHAVPHRWTVEEYDHMVELGALTPDMRIELVDGLIVDKMPNNPPHAYPVGWLTQCFSERGAGRWVVRCQLPVRLPAQRSEPEPDLALLHPPAVAYRARQPEAADVFLLIEVADSSLHTDRGEKLSIYARAGIPEYWILNVPGRVVEVHREPDPATGLYGSVREMRSDESLAPAAFPDAALPVGELLG